MCSSRARRVAGNPTHVTTPLTKPTCSEPIVSVIDPRHPLCGQSFPLRGTIIRPEVGPCCIVWSPEGLERHIPLMATNLAPPAVPVSPLPLSLEGMAALLLVYARLMHHLTEGAPDYDTHTPDTTGPGDRSRGTPRPPAAPTDPTPGGVGVPDSTPATTALPPAGASVLCTAAPAPGGPLRGDPR